MQQRVNKAKYWLIYTMFDFFHSVKTNQGRKKGRKRNNQKPEIKMGITVDSKNYYKDISSVI